MLDSLSSLLEDQIKDLYSAENQLLKALPKMAKAASSDALREAFEGHLEETKGHVERLQEIASLLESSPGGKKCKAMEGLIEEGKEVLEEEGDESVLDAALIIAAQKVEHYEIAAYGSARTLAETLGEDEIVALLQQTLDEEGAADKKLSGIAMDEIIPAAPKNESDGEEGKSPNNSSSGKAANLEKKTASASRAKR